MEEKEIDTVRESLEAFYGEPEWPALKVQHCGKYRAKGGKVKCHIILGENGLHYGDHRGYDKALRQHSWKNDKPPSEINIYFGGFPS